MTGIFQDIDAFCSPNGDIEAEGKTLHCLMAHAQERDEKKRIGVQCRNALSTLVKVNIFALFIIGFDL